MSDRPIIRFFRVSLRTVDRMTERLSKSMSDDLLARIGRAEFKPGDQMPTEQALMTEYGVGRNTAREAMQTLRALGIVEIRPRLGARVLAGRAENALANSALSILLHERTIDELYEVRLILEPAAAAKAATSRTDADLLSIKRALAMFRIAFEVGVGIAEADIDFHHAVAEASGNSVLAHVLGPMSDLLLEARRATAQVPKAVEQAVAEHEEIALAIQKRAPRQARDAMTTHIESGICALRQVREAAKE